MAVELATGYVRLMPSARGFQSALDKELAPEMRKAGENAGDEAHKAFGGKFNSGMKAVGKAGALAFGAAFAGAAVLGKQAIDAASGLEEAQSKVDVVFGDGAGAINEWAKTSATAFGQSERQAKEAASTYGNLFKAFGVGNEPAAEMSTTMVQLASDLASFNNTSVDEALTALQSGISGETEPLKRYGVAINQTRLEAEALRLGLVQGSVDQDKLSKSNETLEKAQRKAAEALKEHGKGSQEYADATRDVEQAEAAMAKVMEGKVPPLDEAAKSQAAYSLIMKDSALAQGDFERTSGGLANSQRTMAAQFENAKASLGEGLLPIMTTVVGFVADKLPVVVDAIKGFAKAIAAGFSGDNVNADGFLGVLQDIGEGVREVVDWFQRNWPTIRTVAKEVIDAVVAALSWWYTEVIPRVIDAVQAVVTWFQDNWPTIQRTVVEVFTALADAWTTYGQPTVEAIVTAFQWVVDWFRDNWPQISERVSGVWEQVQEIFRAAWVIIEAIVRNGTTIVLGIINGVVDTILFVWRHFGDNIVEYLRIAWEFVKGIVEAAIKVVHNIIKTVTALIRGDWEDVWEGIKGIFSGIWDAIGVVVQTAIDNVKNILSAAWTAIKLVFEDAWNGILNFLDDKVLSPMREKFNGIKTFLGNVFESAVEAIKTAWDKMTDIVKKPINFVIGFYNNGIRKVWNAVIAKIGLPELGPIEALNRGGWVPGTGNRDTVPALLTPGEFVVTKKAAEALGPGLLAAMNNPRGTLDPGIFGYAQGGYARSADEALEWARGHAGKRYQFPDVGPDTFDCSGFTSALLNYILGVNPPWRRRHSSGTVGADPALRPGSGDNALGFVIGARPPYMTNAQGASVGHVAATLMGVNMEATPPAVRVGGNARGAGDGMFTGRYHLAGYGGLSDEDKAIANTVTGMRDMRMNADDSWFGGLLKQLFDKLPGMIFDFFMKKLPGVIVDAIKDGLGAVGGFAAGAFKAITPFANGGMVRRNGPILVGEHGPELAWGSRGMYIQSADDLNGRGSGVTINHYGETVTPATIARGIRYARLAA